MRLAEALEDLMPHVPDDARGGLAAWGVARMMLREYYAALRPPASAPEGTGGEQ